MITRLIGGAAAFAVLFSVAAGQAQEVLTIERLLKEGWQISGFTAPGDNRSSFILFRHPKRLYLVNCRVGYDVTRRRRAFVNCYKLK